MLRTQCMQLFLQPTQCGPGQVVEWVALSDSSLDIMSFKLAIVSEAGFARGTMAV